MGYQAKIVTGGKMVLPAALRHELGMKDGDTVIVERVGDSIRVTTRDAVLREFRAHLKQIVPPGISLVDEFIAEKRSEPCVSRRVALDASALIAFLADEPGGDVVKSHQGSAVISTVNYCEVLTTFGERGYDLLSVANTIASLQIEIVAFNEAIAFAAAELRPLTRRHGLSLGDRACLATAQHFGLPVLTADRAWRDVDVGVAITLIR